MATRFRPDYALRPGRVTAIRGIIFQNDAQTMLGGVFIKPFEKVDRKIVGIRSNGDSAGLAMHTGVHVEIDGAEEYVAEQLVGSLYLNFRNGLNWTPLDKFRERNRGGWDVTVPATAFRGVGQAGVSAAVARLNSIEGHPFVGEDCTAFVERSFGGHRMFADSPMLLLIGLAVRVGDPALPLLRSDPPLDARARALLQLDAIRNLPPARADVASANGRLWIGRLMPAVILGVLVGVLARRVWRSTRH